MNNTWKVHKISQRHKLLAEYITNIQHTLLNKPITIRNFLDIHVDNFGTY